MMKLLFQLCFLVLAISSVSRVLATRAPQATTHRNVEKQETPIPQRLKETQQEVDPYVDQKDLNVSTTRQNLTQSQAENTNKSVTPATLYPEPSGPTSQSSSVTTQGKTSESGESSTTDPGSTPKASTSPKPVAAASGSSSWGYVFLVLIIILIIALCVILLILRRASRTYSFDLQRPAPSSNVYEPSGTFGQVYLDDLDLPVDKDVISDDLSTTPVPNGTSPQLEEKAADEEDAPQEQPEASDPQNSSSSSTSSLSGDDQAEKKSNQMSSNNLFFDAAEEPQQQQKNENNNNPSVCSSDPFVEINLDEPPWSDQLLPSPQPTSSVLPFSSFSFSSSSSSS